MTEILKTKDYSIFKANGLNRKICVTNLRDICQKMEESNLLPWNPIIVNGNMEVLDGQHRLEACKLLDLEAYYIVMPHGTDVDMMTLNVSMKKWGTEDFINYWAFKGNPHYQFLVDISKKTKWSSGVIIRFMHFKTKIIREGKVTFTDERKKILENLVEGVMYVTNGLKEATMSSESSKAWIVSASSVHALSNLLQHAAITPQELLDKLILCSISMSRKSSGSQYAAMYLAAWNYRRRERIEIEDIMRSGER